MPRRIELEKGELVLKEEEIEGFLEREVKPIGNTGRVNCPKRYIGRRVYLIVTKEEKSTG
ncbi:hypothetical protein AKJ39_03455 [candidate division MSBL1 archaeon SCGC-AAA259J03]|uniref:Transposase n=3 Tax=candidate division MSBL1 TaxID=215777 RepID=A0A656YWC4_9EURY|nr:hypothetical protein AKJ66_04225 [candidate division MSBL1 archaeon SCGC-AAA259E22]KXA97319.1 hypothetical protein AKJ39_03455 [candidate division MSBL1 archaeon SCGC-AAA259J03]KXB05270.1 hypothetical protein AKJ50_01355 [candidate division MSBL1 archaeon SCGC-AAA382A13]